MLRNRARKENYWLRPSILNEVLSLNAQESRSTNTSSKSANVLNEVLSLNAQEYAQAASGSAREASGPQ